MLILSKHHINLKIVYQAISKTNYLENFNNEILRY